jgi:uncharacterized protein YjbI with pentapeptide repeats
MILTIFLSLLAVLGILFFIWLFLKRQAYKIQVNDEKERWKAEIEHRKTLIQLLASVIVIVGFFLTFEELKESRKRFEQSRLEFEQSQENFKSGQISSRFGKAIELLANEKDTSKIVSIYVLKQIAKESPENYLGAVIEVLAEFLRSSEYHPEKDEGEEDEIKPEAQIAMTILKEIRTDDNKFIWGEFPRMNLSNVNLRRADLSGANLSEANLNECVLIGADLKEANLGRTVLRGANLSGADLTGANLRGANLRGTNLRGAQLRGADLSDAVFWDADLTKASLWKAILRGTDFWEANLTKANLFGAKFVGPDFSGANLREVNLKETAGYLAVQLKKAKTLYGVKGLPPEMEKELRKEKPGLFEEPEVKDEKEK